MTDGWALDDAVEHLIDGPSTPLSDVPTGTGRRAGVFTLWYRNRLLYLGRSRIAAAEARKTNLAQADAVTGRLRGIRRQPAVSIQRALSQEFPSDWVATSGSDQKRASQLLAARAAARWVETPTGPAADALMNAVEARLNQAGDASL